ncbi:MAG: hypothetical protein ABI400_03425, partial [Lacisediminihabitans sp.]
MTTSELPSTASAPLPPSRKLVAIVPGLALAALIAVIATIVGHFVPLLGGPVSGIIIGVILAG